MVVYSNVVVGVGWWRRGTNDLCQETKRATKENSIEKNAKRNAI